MPQSTRLKLEVEAALPPVRRNFLGLFSRPSTMGHGAVATELLTICLLGCCFGVAISACNPDGTRDGHDGAPLIATVGAPCDAVDDRDIEATAKCFY